MRTEQLINECKAFQGERECYIHVEKPQDGDYATLIGGDLLALTQGVFNIVSRMSEISGTPARVIFKGLFDISKKVTHTSDTTIQRGEMQAFTQKTKYDRLLHDKDNVIEALQRERDESAVKLKSDRAHYNDLLRKKDKQASDLRKEIERLNRQITDMESIIRKDGEPYGE